MKILYEKFFSHPVLDVAPYLLGKYLVRKMGDEEIALPITEVEAYDGHEDLASHASRGKTKRNEVMFGPAGYFYVYFTYGMHWMLNVVTGPKGYPAAILIRGAGPVVDFPKAQSAKGEANQKIHYGTGEVSGPARLTKFLKIDRKFNGRKAEPKTGLWFEDRGITVKKIKKTPRIGVAYAGPVWAKKKYRFLTDMSLR